jgi:hypothetical protein
MLIGFRIIMGFPTERELKRIRAKLNKSQGFLMLSPNADQFR